MSSSTRQIISTEKAPQAIGPYSAAVRDGDYVFVAGTLGIDPENGELVPGGIESETGQALRNIEEILKAAGSSLGAVVKTTVFMANLAEFAKMNGVYAEFFKVDPPARSTFQVAALPRAAAIEIEAIASVGGD